MATIKPFVALRPQAVYADKMLSLRPSPQGLNNDHIVGDLQKMISAGEFYQEDSPCMFIYEITKGNTVQTGVWAVTDLDDFESGHLKTHESTLESHSSGMVSYRDEVGLEGGPLLMTHRPNSAIRSLLFRIKQTEANSVYYSNKVFHRMWTVYDLKTIEKLSACFSELQQVYLADGHHRLEAAVKCRQIRRSAGKDPADFNYISSCYMSSDQLKIKEYHRVVLPSDEIHIDEVFRDLKRSFSITKSPRNEIVMPQKKNEFGLFLAGRWYTMAAKQNDISSLPDACLLQEMVFRPFFRIEKPETDQRLIPVAGGGAVEELERILLESPAAIAFTLCAMNADELIDIAQQGIMLPPKSTWIEPKIPSGLLLRKLGKAGC